MPVHRTDARPPVFRDRGMAVWERDPNSDIECPICVFEKGAGPAHAYICRDHPHRPKLIGTRAYHCPFHQREVQPLMILGEPLLANALGRYRLLVAPGVTYGT